MKFICVIIASLLVSQAYAAIPAVFAETEDLTVDECVEAAQCIAEKFNETEFELDSDTSIVVDVVLSLIGVVQGYLDCQAILSEPPTRWQELQHSTCMTLWRAQALLTAIRLQRVVSEASDNVRESWATVQDTCARGQSILPCIGHLIENPDSTEIAPY